MAYKDPNDERARVSRRKHYLKNKEQYYANNKLKHQRMMEYVWEVKSKPCMDCGKTYPPYVMDFDHRNQEEKSHPINYIIKHQGWEKLYSEIDKCDVVCANCHRIRTAIQLNYTHVGTSGRESVSKTD